MAGGRAHLASAHACVHVCMYVCVYGSMYVFMCVLMYVHMYVYIYLYLYMCILRIVQHTTRRALVTVAPQLIGITYIMPHTYVLRIVVYASMADAPAESIWLVIAHI